VLPDNVLVQAAPIPDHFLPSDGFNTFVFPPTLAPGSTTTVDFALRPVTPAEEGTIIFDVFNDANGNGIKDEGEGAVEDAVVFTFELLNAVNIVNDPPTDENSVQFTDANGSTTHTGLIPDVVLAQINAVLLPAGFTTITSPPVTPTSGAGFEFVTLTAGQTVTVQIGLAP